MSDQQVGAVAGQYQEMGTPGLELWSGYFRQAHDTELFWPGVFRTFNRIRRSDPEIGGIVRPAFAMLARGVRLEWETPDKPSGDDERAREYGQQVLEDMEGGPDRLIETVASYVPFMGWGWWEVVAGLRNPAWRPPGGDEWESQFDDGLPAIRRLAWRDHSSFERWEADERSGRLLGMVQHDTPNPPVTLPLGRSLHLTFGDPVSPEGLSPLEAVWRLERIKAGLEIIQGIGFEHAAGYAKFQTAAALTDEDRRGIAEAARAMLTAQQGNYIRLPGHVSAEIMDTDFAAGPALLEAIRYYGLLKLQVFIMQWAAVATTAGTGALAAHADSSEMSLIFYNAMWEGFAQQIDAQLGRRLFGHPMVRARFPGMTRRPRLVARPVEKGMPLNLLSQFVAQIAPIVPLGGDDFVAIRRRSGFLPESLPAATVEEPAGTVEEEPGAGVNDEEAGEEEEAGGAEMVYRAVGELVGELRRAMEESDERTE